MFLKSVISVVSSVALDDELLVVWLLKSLETDLWLSQKLACCLSYLSSEVSMLLGVQSLCLVFEYLKVLVSFAQQKH